MARRTSSPKPGVAQPAPLAPQIEPVGASGLVHHVGLINDEPLLKLKGRRAMKEFREMYDNDAVVGGIVRLATEMIAQTEHSLEPAGTDPATDMKALHIAKTSLGDMQSTWQEFIDELMSMTVFGHSYMEMWFKKRCGDHELRDFNSKYADGYYGLGNVQLRAQESLDRWSIADDGTILGMYQRPAPTYDLRYIDMQRALLFRTSAAKSNPEGRSWLRPGWRSWWICKRMQELEAIGIERDVAGYPDFQAPVEYFLATATTEQQAMLANLRKMSERIRQDKYMGVVRPSEKDKNDKPTGHAFQLIQGGSRNAGVFDLIIKRYESRIAISMLGEIVLIGQDGSGSLALSRTHKSMLAGALGSILRRIEDVINRHLLPRLIRANGLPDVSPTFKFEDVESADELAFAQAVSALVGGGVLTPDAGVERYVRDYLNLPPIGDISPDQLAEAAGGRAEQVNGAEDPGVADAAHVERALERTVPMNGAPPKGQMPLPLSEPKVGAPAKPAANSVPAAVPEQIESAADDEDLAATMSADECAAHAGVSRASIVSAIRRGKLPGARIGSSYRIPRHEFMTFMRGGGK